MDTVSETEPTYEETRRALAEIEGVFCRIEQAHERMKINQAEIA